MEGTMTISELPAPIQEFIDATNAGDTERFLAVFTDDAYLNDWGREFHGVDGVGDWNRTDNIGMRSHFELVSAEAGAGADEYTVTLKVSGDRFNGTGPLKFRLRDGKIASVVIA
jgi:ketosteroid isomerase-like protein